MGKFAKESKYAQVQTRSSGFWSNRYFEDHFLFCTNRCIECRSVRKNTSKPFFVLSCQVTGLLAKKKKVGTVPCLLQHYIQTLSSLITLKVCQSNAPKMYFSLQMPCCWLSFVAVVSLLSLSWLYICLISFNDQEELNG